MDKAHVSAWHRRQWKALGWAFALEIALVAGLLALLLAQRTPPAPQEVALSIEPLPKPVAEKRAPPPKPEPPKPVVRPVTTPPPSPTVVAPAPVAPPPIQLPQPVVEAPAVVITKPVEAVAIAAPPPVVRVEPPPPPPPPDNADIARSYNAKLSAAVQAAFVVPSAARNLSFKGRARIEFGLRDGVVSAIRVVQSSGLGVVDRAAVTAVESAAFPSPPPALQGRDGVYQIWVACY